MKNLWPYITVFFATLCIGLFIWHEISFNKCREKIEELQNSQPQTEYVYTTDTITIDKVQTKYKTKKEFVHDTVLLVDVDSVTIEVPVHDTFYLPVEHNVYTSTLDTAGFHLKSDIHYSGIEPKLDSINYDIIIEQKKPCCWLRRLFNRCK